MTREDSGSPPLEGGFSSSHVAATTSSRDCHRHSRRSSHTSSNSSHWSSKKLNTSSEREPHFIPIAENNTDVLWRKKLPNELLSAEAGAPTTTAQISPYVMNEGQSATAAAAAAAEDDSDFLPSPDEFTLSDEEDFLASPQSPSNSLRSHRSCSGGSKLQSSIPHLGGAARSSSRDHSRRSRDSDSGRSLSSASRSTLSYHSASRSVSTSAWSSSSSSSSSTGENHSSTSSGVHLTSCRPRTAYSSAFSEGTGDCNWKEHTSEERSCFSSRLLLHHPPLDKETPASSLSDAAASTTEPPPAAAADLQEVISFSNAASPHQQQAIPAARSSRSSTTQSSFSTASSNYSSSSTCSTAGSRSGASSSAATTKKSERLIFPDGSLSSAIASSSFFSSDSPLGREEQSRSGEQEVTTPPTSAAAASRGDDTPHGDDGGLEGATERHHNLFSADSEDSLASLNLFEGGDGLPPALSEEQLLIPQSPRGAGEVLCMGRSCSSYSSSDPLRERERREARERETLLLARQIVSRFRAVRGTAAAADAVQLLLRYFHVRKRHIRDTRSLERLAAACCYISARQKGDDSISLFCLSDLAAELLPLPPGRRRTRGSNVASAGTQAEKEHQQQQQVPPKEDEAPSPADNKEKPPEEAVPREKQLPLLGEDRQQKDLQQQQQQGVRRASAVQQRQENVWWAEAAQPQKQNSETLEMEAAFSSVYEPSNDQRKMRAARQTLFPAPSSSEGDSRSLGDACAVFSASSAARAETARAGRAATETAGTCPSEEETADAVAVGNAADSISAAAAAASCSTGGRARAVDGSQQQWNKAAAGHARCRTLARWIARVCRRLQLQQLPRAEPDAFLRCGALLRRVHQLVEQRVEEEEEKTEEQRAALLRVQQQLQQNEQELQEQRQRAQTQQQQRVCAQQQHEMRGQQRRLRQREQRVRQQKHGGAGADEEVDIGRVLVGEIDDEALTCQGKGKQQQVGDDGMRRQHVEDTRGGETEEDVDLMLLRSVFGDEEGRTLLSAVFAEELRERRSEAEAGVRKRTRNSSTTAAGSAAAAAASLAHGRPGKGASEIGTADAAAADVVGEEQQQEREDVFLTGKSSEKGGRLPGDSKRPHPTVSPETEQQKSKRSRDEDEVRRLLSVEVASEVRQRSTAANSNDSDSPRADRGHEQYTESGDEGSHGEDSCVAAHLATAAAAAHLPADASPLPAATVGLPAAAGLPAAGAAPFSSRDMETVLKKDGVAVTSRNGRRLQRCPALLRSEGETAVLDASSSSGAARVNSSNACGADADSGSKERSKGLSSRNVSQNGVFLQSDLPREKLAAAAALKSIDSHMDGEKRLSLVFDQREERSSAPQQNGPPLPAGGGNVMRSVSSSSMLASLRSCGAGASLEGKRDGEGSERDASPGSNALANGQVKETATPVSAGRGDPGGNYFAASASRNPSSTISAATSGAAATSAFEGSLDHMVAVSCYDRETTKESTSSNNESCESALLKLLGGGMEKSSSGGISFRALRQQSRDSSEEGADHQATTAADILQQSSSRAAAASGTVVASHTLSPQYMQRVLNLHVKKSAWQQRSHSRALEKLRRERDKVFKGLVLMYRVLTAVYNRASNNGSRRSSTAATPAARSGGSSNARPEEFLWGGGGTAGRSEDPLDGIWRARGRSDAVCMASLIILVFQWVQVVVPQRVVIDALHVDRKSVYTRRMEHMRIMRALFRRLKESNSGSHENDEKDLAARFCEVLDSPTLSRQLLEVAEEGLCASDVMLILRRDPLASLYTSSSQPRSQTEHKDHEQQSVLQQQSVQQQSLVQQQQQEGQKQEHPSNWTASEQRHRLPVEHCLQRESFCQSGVVDEGHSADSASFLGAEHPSRQREDREDTLSRAASFAAVARAVAAATGAMDPDVAAGSTFHKDVVIADRAYLSCTRGSPSLHSRGENNFQAKERTKGDYFYATQHNSDSSVAGDTYYAELEAASDGRRGESASGSYCDGSEQTAGAYCRAAAAAVAGVGRQLDKMEETLSLHRDTYRGTIVSSSSSSSPNAWMQSVRSSATTGSDGKSNTFDNTGRSVQSGSPQLSMKTATIRESQTAVRVSRPVSTKNAAAEKARLSSPSNTTTEGATEESAAGSGGDAGGPAGALEEREGGGGKRGGALKDNKGKVTRGRGNQSQSLPSTEQLKLAKIAVLQSLPPAADVVSLQFERTQQRWVCKWLQSSSEGRATGWKRRCFSVLKYGYDGAHQLAAAAATKLRDGRQQLQQQQQQQGKSLTKCRRSHTGGTAVLASLSPTLTRAIT